MDGAQSCNTRRKTLQHVAKGKRERKTDDRLRSCRGNETIIIKVVENKNEKTRKYQKKKKIYLNLVQGQMCKIAKYKK